MPPGQVPSDAVHVEEALHLGDHVVEATRLVARRRLEGVAVHGVADPGDVEPGGRDLLDQRGQRVADPAGAHPGDEA